MRRIEDIDRDPFLQDWIQKGRAAQAAGREGMKATSVADVLGEQALFASAVLNGGVQSDDGDIDSPVLARAIYEAQPVFWTEEMMKAAFQIDIPDHVIAPGLCPLPLMWWAFPSTFPSVKLAGSAEEVYPEGILLVDQGVGIEVVGIYPDHQKGTLRTGALCRITYRENFVRREGSVDDAVVAMLVFMQSPALSENRIRGLDRPERRRVPLEYSTETVNYVTLRRRPHEAGSGNGDGEFGGYSVRWIVSGHMRKQWYPSLEAHKLIWIAPYVKGPDSAPLKQTIYKVVR